MVVLLLLRKFTKLSVVEVKMLLNPKVKRDYKRL